MADAVRHYRHDETEVGEFVFLRFGVEFGDDGIKKLLHFIPLAQNEWAKQDTAGSSTRTEVFDSPTSRIVTRLDTTATGTHKIRKRVLLPLDFGFFPDGALGIITRLNNIAAGVTLKLTLLRGGAADSIINAVSIKPSVVNTFEFFSFKPGSVYSAGDSVTIEVEFVSASIGDKADVADVEFQHSNERGNV